MSIINQVMNQVSLQSIKTELKKNALVMEIHGEYISSPSFQKSAEFQLNVLGMSVNQVVAALIQDAQNEKSNRASA